MMQTAALVDAALVNGPGRHPILVRCPLNLVSAADPRWVLARSCSALHDCCGAAGFLQVACIPGTRARSFIPPLRVAKQVMD